MRERELQTVTAFIVRRQPREVLLLRDPFTGIQFPAGAIEAAESAEAAAVRAAAEASGLGDIGAAVPAGVAVDEVVGSGWLVAETTPVFFRPDPRASSWATLRRGVAVTSEREQAGFVHVTYEEVDRLPSSQYVTARITGWVRREALTKVRRRFFFVLPYAGETAAAWTVGSGGQGQVLFWAPLDTLPAIMPTQDEWVPYLTAATGGAPLLAAMMRKAATA